MSFASQLAAAREELLLAAQERIALGNELNTVRYAAELMSDELARRTTTPATVTRPLSSEKTVPPSPPKAIESALLEAKGKASSARLRVEQLQAQLQDLRSRSTRSPGSRRSSLVPLPPDLHVPASLLSPRSPRKASSRSIADFDAFIQIGDGKLLPCRISITAGCAVGIHTVCDASKNAVRREAVLSLDPPFCDVSDILPCGDDADRDKIFAEMLPWMAALPIQVQSCATHGVAPGESQSYPKSAVICGIYDAVADAYALILDHDKKDSLPCTKNSSGIAPGEFFRPQPADIISKTSELNPFQRQDGTD